MSYSDLLSQYANKMNEVRSHGEEVNQAIAETKAGSLKEAYDRGMEHLQNAAEASSAAAGAWMAGRAMYKKFKGKNKEEEGEEEGEGDAGEAGADEGGQGAADAGKAVGQGAGDEAGSGATEATDTISDIQQTIPKSSDFGGELESGPKPEEPTGDLGRNVQASEEEAKNPVAEAKADVAEAEGPTLEGAPAEAVEATAGDTVQAANVGEQVGSKVAQSAIKQGAKAAGEGVAEETGTAIGEGLASQALDFLGPVGLGIGAITGLVDLFKGIFGKKPKTAEELKTPIQTQGAGLDVKGLTSSDAPAQATLV